MRRRQIKELGVGVQQVRCADLTRDCCPSAFSISTYTWNRRTLAGRGARTVPKVPSRFFVR